MSDSKVFMIPDAVANRAGTALDPNLLITLIMNNGGFGGNGNWIWIIFLFLIWGRNGFGGFGEGNALGTGYLSNQINNTTGRDLLMQAINGNNNAITLLSSSLNCDVNSIKCAINGIQNSLCQVGNLVGMSASELRNAVTMGNMNLALLIAQCCCDNKLLVQSMGYDGQLRDLANTSAIINKMSDVANSMTQGFATSTYQTAQQTCSLLNGLKDQTLTILNKLDAMEDSRKDREISNLTALLTAANSRAERAAELAPITLALNEIQCKQPNTVTVPYQPFVTIPNCVAFNAACGFNPYLQGGSIWS